MSCTGTRSFASFVLLMLLVVPVSAQEMPPPKDQRVYDIIDAASAERLEQDIRTLANFGTRHTLSDTTSDTRGIGAARRWIKDQFDAVSEACGGCLEVYYQRTLVPAEGNRRIFEDTYVVNVVAVQRGTVHPNRYVVMSGDIDSRASDVMDAEIDAPGANDNASGMAGAIEAARILSQYEFDNSIVYAGLSGEEQGLYGGQHLAQKAKEEGWEIIGVLNNDMIGNIEGGDGVIDNTTFRVFSQMKLPSEEDRWSERYYGGENDGPSRQVARYVDRIAEQYFPNLDAMMIYRLDRFGRGGHHTPFNNEGFPAVRIMETHENYIWQHQDVRVEDGIAYGDVIEHVDFDYARTMTALNAAVLASTGWAPPEPDTVRIGGIVEPAARLAWTPVDDPGLAGYKLYWRDTTAPQWQHYRFVPAGTSEFTLENVIIDNYLFGVAAVGEDGNESIVVFPSEVMR